MADIHLTRDLLWAVVRGDLSASVLTRIGTQHLMSLCATCREEITAFQRERAAPPAADYDRAFRLLPTVLAEQIPRLEREQQGAARDLEELLALSREERTRKVERAHKRFRSAALVRLLVEESRRRAHTDPGESLHLARLGRLVAHCNPQMPCAFDLIALTTAQMANACRVGSDRRQAEEHFGHARYVIAHHGVTDTEVLARVDYLEGSLRMDQRLFTEAEELLARAATLYRVSGHPAETARVLVTLGSGLGGTVVALSAAILIAAAAGERVTIGARGLLLPALLAVPHLASAVGPSHSAANSAIALNAINTRDIRKAALIVTQDT